MLVVSQLEEHSKTSQKVDSATKQYDFPILSEALRCDMVCIWYMHVHYLQSYTCTQCMVINSDTSPNVRGGGYSQISREQGSLRSSSYTNENSQAIFSEYGGGGGFNSIL